MLAQRESCEIVTWYEDPGITGDSIEARPGFRRMLADAQKGNFSVILCDNQDRFGRFDSIEAGAVISPLRKAGVRMVTNAQGSIDWNDFAGRMMYAIQTEGKHQFLQDLSRNVTRSLANSTEAKTFIRSAPLGMCRVFYDEHGREQSRVGAYGKSQRPKAWTVRLAPCDDLQEREAMRWAFQTYADSEVGLACICKGLQARWVLTENGKRLVPITLRSFFQNKKYIGIVEVGRYPSGKYHRMDADGNIARTNQVKETLVNGKRAVAVKEFANAGEPLIDVQTFERVQRKLEQRAISGRKPRSNRYLVTGILRCGHCGGPMHGQRAKNEGRSGYYACLGYRTGKCDGHLIRQDTIEAAVLEIARNVVFSPGNKARVKEVAKPSRKRKALKAARNGWKTNCEPCRRR